MRINEFTMKMKPFAFPIAGAGVAMTVFFASPAMERAMFSENPRFTVSKVEVHTDLAVNADEVKRVTGIVEGVNLFGFNASRESREFLRAYSNDVARLEIRKIPPSTVVMTAKDRVPALRVGQTAHYVDREGFMMVATDAAAQQRWLAVPGLSNGKNQIKTEPGGRITDYKMVVALSIANTHKSMNGMAYEIKTIDIGNEVFAVVETAGPIPRRIRIPWDEIDGEPSVKMALDMASKTLANPDALNLMRFDVLMSVKPPAVIGSPTWD